MRRMHLFIWITTALLLACWTLLAWASAWLLGLDPSWISDLAARLGELPLAPTLDAWLPGWDGLLASLMTLLQTLLAGFGQAGVVLVWVVWGLGALLLLGTAALGSGLVQWVRRSSTTQRSTAAAA
jgi:hypothetical protein